MVAWAEAARLSGTSDAQTPDVVRRRLDAARTLLASALSRAGGAPCTPDLMWDLASVILRGVEAQKDGGDAGTEPAERVAAAKAARAQAGVLLLRLHDGFPAFDRADEARDAAAGLLLAADEGDAVKDLSTGASIKIADAQISVLERMLQRPQPEPRAGDRWRYELGIRLSARALAMRGVGGDLAAAAIDEILHALSLLREASQTQALAAGADRAAATLLDSCLIVWAGLESPGAGASKWNEFARLAGEWAVKRDPARVDLYSLPLAEAWLAEGAKESVDSARLRGVLASLAGETIPTSVVSLKRAADAVRLRAKLDVGRLQRLNGRRDAAFQTLRGVADALEPPPAAPGQSTASQPSWLFWSAWCELLEMLAEQNAEGGRSGAIRLQLARLSIINRALGGGEYRTRLERVRDDLK